MLKFVILLALLPRLPHAVTTLRTCTPNTPFIFNGVLCFCDNRGHFNEANCRTISRRQPCQPGQIIWQDCNQCICQENGYLLCSNSRCSDDFKLPILRQDLSIYGPRCTPYRFYYINCSICVCPASGITSEAQCVNDISCSSQNNRINIGNNNKIYCIPNVMYISQCKECLCPDNGYFDNENCVDKCKETISLRSPVRRCIAGTLYRAGCDICRCPSTNAADDSVCISTVCNNTSFHALRTDSKRCTPYSFTVPRCMYCDCNMEGTINENACLEIDCAKTNRLSKHTIGKSTCYLGEIVSICTECFCTRSGNTIPKYCSTVCSYQNRLNILETVLKDSSDSSLIERSKIKRVKGNELCVSNSLYLATGIFCLCPENGHTDFKFCTSVTEELKPENQDVFSNNIEIEYNFPCEPNSFVEFDCNTCYCNRNGKIDPKWCTNDDCQAKRLIQESHKTHNLSAETKASGTCRPGAISKLKCNYCICPESGIFKEIACTQNECAEFDQTLYNDQLTCEPLAYYEVDCNICFCPRDGIRNVAKCTKNHCEKGTLRSDSCIAGQIFCDGCNFCVCPPDGNKMGKVCTSYVCPEVVPGKLHQLSDELIDNHATINYTKSLDHCFPGEEFEDGCKLCICPEHGLKMYATCESILCDAKYRNEELETTINTISKLVNISSVRSRRNSHDCYKYNVSTSAERKECTPGTMYIIRCKECICPYLGNINNFCRPLPKNMYCEQAFPYFNYLPMGRRIIKDEVTNANNMKSTSDVSYNTTNTELESKEVIQINVKHDKHTEFKCEKPGTILDKCFICDCAMGNVVIEEHCFKSDADNCANATPTFLFRDKVYW